VYMYLKQAVTWQMTLISGLLVVNCQVLLYCHDLGVNITSDLSLLITEPKLYPKHIGELTVFYDLLHSVILHCYFMLTLCTYTHLLSTTVLFGSQSQSMTVNLSKKFNDDFNTSSFVG